MIYLDSSVLDELIEILGEEELRVIAESFATQLVNQLNQLRENIANSDLAAGARVAHSIKGGAGNLGAQVLAAAAGNIEHYANAGNLAEVIAILATLSEIIQHTFAALRFRGLLPPGA